MFKTQISKNKKITLFTLMVVLNVVLRIPSIPHEKGADSFFIHTLANSITIFGSANWWAHWLSVFGLYPYSYASAIPFSLSGVSQITGLTGIQMERMILLYCIFFGLLSIFTMYVLAGTICDDFYYKYLMALLFSISQGVMIFSTWEISSRGPFVILLPLFIFIILKKMNLIKTIILLGLLGLFMMSTHHFFWLLIPLVATFIFLKILLLFSLSLKRKYCVKPEFLNYIYVCILATVLLYPFLTHSMITYGSRYGYLIDVFITNTRWTGPLIIFSFIGMAYIIMKKDKKFEEWYFLLALLAFTPFAYDQTYGMYIILPFLVFGIGIALRNILSINKLGKNRAVTLVIIISLLLSTTFSAFYNHERTGSDRDWYMTESNYHTGLWINDNIGSGKYILSDSGNFNTIRTIAIQNNASSIIIGDVLGLTYNHIEKQFIYDNLAEISIYSSYYYNEGPYKVEVRDIYRDIHWYLQEKDIKTIKEKYNCDYLLTSSFRSKPKGFKEGNSGIIYTDGILEVCDLEHL